MVGAQAERPQFRATDLVAGRSVAAGQAGILWDIDYARRAASRGASGLDRALLNPQESQTCP
jgi:hypothetical protein